MRALKVAIVMSLCACCSKRQPNGSATSAQVATPVLRDSASAASAARICIPLWPTPVRLSGTIVREEKYGPPGYGESPKRDARLQVFLLELPEAVAVCADTSRVAPQPQAEGVRLLQLTEHVSIGSLRKHLGASVEVFGTIRRRVWPSDFTDALIRVDSIPVLEIRKFERRGA